MKPETEIISPAIREAVRIAIVAGNKLKAVSSEWKPKQAVFMDQPINSATRSQIMSALPGLEHVITDGTPHNPASETFIDRDSDTVVAFPAPGEKRRWY